MEEMMDNDIPENPRNETTRTKIINTSTCPTWKLYRNPFYNSDHNLLQHQHQPNSSPFHSSNKNLNNCLHLPLSDSFWDLTFSNPAVMESELELARAQIIELKTELEYERKARKKSESMNRRLIKELNEERNGREAVERVCQELAKDISSDKSEISKMKREMEEERKMMRMSEVLREERVQMKLAEAKLFFEEKIWELESCKQSAENSPSNSKHKNSDEIVKIASRTTAVRSSSGKFRDLMLAEKLSFNGVVDLGESTKPVSGCKGNNGISASYSSSTAINQRKASPEAENPHIKRGIKGFVEFPKVIRAIGSKNNRHWGTITKLECQKSQLKILLKQKSPIRSNSLIMS